MFVNTDPVNGSLLNRGLARLAGASSGAITASATATIALTGSALGVLTASATLTQQVPLAGTCELTVTGIAALKHTDLYQPPVNGVYLNFFAVNGPSTNVQSGSATCTATATATLTRTVSLSGDATGVVTTSSPGISGTNKLAGDSTVTVTTEGLLVNAKELAVSVAAVTAVTGALEVQKVLTGSSNGIVTGTGALTRVLVTGPLTSTYVVGQTTAIHTHQEIFAVAEAETNIAVTANVIYVNDT